MEQQQFKVSFPVSTKLLISVVLLLIIVIVFLNVSTILILKEDKRAYTYQTQSTESILAGKEFTGYATRALDTLKLALANIDPSKPITPLQTSAVQSVVDNQSEVTFISSFAFENNSGKLTPINQAFHPKIFKELQLVPQDFELNAEMLKPMLPDLFKQGFVFITFSKIGSSPVLGAIVADLKLQSAPTGMPIALGVISLKDYATELKGLALTIATHSGRLLFDTDPTAFAAKKAVAQDPLFESALESKLADGAKEYDINGERYLGSYVRPGLDLIVLARTEYRKAMRSTYALTEKFILLGLTAVGAAIIFAIFFSKSLTAPINLLYQATRKIATGDFDLNLEVQSKDELGALTGSFNLMSSQIQDLIQAKLHTAQLENELAIASTVQQTLIPPPVFKNNDILIHSHYQSATECGGDWWGFFGVGRKLCIMISDATGHGLPSALITASARSCISVLNKLAQEDPEFTFSPSAMLSYANRVIFDASLGNIMMTFFIGVIDLDAMTITYSNAGHNPPWLFKNENENFRLTSLIAVGHRLGEARDVPDFEEKTVPISHGDILFMYTDGLIEGKDQKGEQYGKKRARQVVEANLKEGPEKLVVNLVADFLKHNDGKNLDDDITLAVAKILSSGGGGVSNDPFYAKV